MIKLTEILFYKNYWVDPSGKIIEVDDHIQWAIDNITTDFIFDDNGIPINPDDGSIAEEWIIYEKSFKKGFVRMVKQGDDSALMIDYSIKNKPSHKQMQSIKNFAIENGWKLYDSIMRKEIELL